jgi:DNA-binding MarR family transcriptional regulator
VLFHLGLYGKMTASDIGARAKMHKTKISRAVQRLADRRFLTRAKDKSDRRVEHLTLTPQGISAYEDLRETARQYDGRLLKALGKKEGKVLRKALIKLMQAEQSRFT